jgi:hypothetical protein
MLIKKSSFGFSYALVAMFCFRRGMNPPHRVKSISMASFTTEEVEFLKKHGNGVGVI